MNTLTDNVCGKSFWGCLFSKCLLLGLYDLGYSVFYYQCLHHSMMVLFDVRGVLKFKSNSACNSVYLCHMIITISWMQETPGPEILLFLHIETFPLFHQTAFLKSWVIWGKLSLQSDRKLKLTPMLWEYVEKTCFTKWFGSQEPNS